jgi:hypothetical protein
LKTKLAKDLKAGDVLELGDVVEAVRVGASVTEFEIRGVKWRANNDAELTLFPVEEAGVKYDSDKPRFSLVPSASLRAIAQVLTYGAKKYPQADNWKRVDNARERYTDALLRHVYAWIDGEALDPESGLHHLAHAGCCVLFLLHFEVEK